ncbi:MAG TPA: DUF2182 domain-containing protein [Longimicrobium sp.]
MKGAAAAPGVLHRARRFGWRHPEWWVLACAAWAWAWMLTMPHPHGHATGADVRWTGAMVIAMMLPLTIPHVRHVARSSLWRRRHRGIAGFLAGYLAVWMLAMMAIVAALGIGGRLTGWTVVAGVATAAVVLWEVAPFRRRMLRRCGRTMPLAPRGWRADADCARFGAQAGASCVSVCWALMAVCVVFAHSLPVMAVLFGVQLSGRYRRDPSPALAALAVLGVCLAALATDHA